MYGNIYDAADAAIRDLKENEFEGEHFHAPPGPTNAFCAATRAASLLGDRGDPVGSLLYHGLLDQAAFELYTIYGWMRALEAKCRTREEAIRFHKFVRWMLDVNEDREKHQARLQEFYPSYYKNGETWYGFTGPLSAVS